MKLARKYPIFLILTTIGTSVAIFIAFLGVLRDSIQKEITNRGQSTTQAFAQANGPLLLERNTSQVQYNLAALGNDPSIVNARVADHRGEIVASLEKSEIGATLPTHFRDPSRPAWDDPLEHAYHFREDIRYGDTNVGTFVLSLSRVPVEMAQKSATIKALWFVGGIAAAIAMFTLMLVRRELRPLRIMSHALGGIAKGDFSRRVPVERKDEIGELAEALNHMLVRAELFFHYVDKMIIERLVADESLAQPGGRERTLAVVFGDMRGYTAMSNRRSANEVVKIVNTFFYLFIECIAHFGGVVDKTMGDAIMAVFEGRKGEDPKKRCERAVLALTYMKCASRILNAYIRENPEVAERLALEPREFGFAMATGPAIVGNIGSRRRMDYTVCGRVVNLASRLEGLTKSGEVIIDNFSRYDSEGLLETETLPEIQPKGFSTQEMVTPHRVTALSQEETERMRAFMKRLFSYALVKEMLMPEDLPQAEQHKWCTRAETRLGRVIRGTPAWHFFVRADVQTGRLILDGPTGSFAAPRAAELSPLEVDDEDIEAASSGK